MLSSLFRAALPLTLQPKDEARLWQDRKLALELRLWASFRGQTLVRTVEGGSSPSPSP